ncbi:MAG: L-threonylcarbamoyladenylate synthase [Candidatus Omnitrophota bacterium]
MNSSLKKTALLKVDPANPDKSAISTAADALRKGALVAFPTETVYGLGVNMLDEAAVSRLYEIKKRPRTKPFTVLVSDTGVIEKAWDCNLSKEARSLADRFWPGPMTMILKSSSGEKIGFRVPDNKIAMMLVTEAKVPIATPSANVSGSVPARCAGDVLKEFGGRIDIIIDGGPSKVGIESTVVDLTAPQPKIVRQGAIPAREILNSL